MNKTSDADFFFDVITKIEYNGNHLQSVYDSMSSKSFQLEFLQFVENLIYLKDMGFEYKRAKSVTPKLKQELHLVLFKDSGAKFFGRKPLRCIEFLYHTIQLLQLVTAPEFVEGKEKFLSKIRDQKLYFNSLKNLEAIAFTSAAADLVPQLRQWKRAGDS